MDPLIVIIVATAATAAVGRTAAAAYRRKSESLDALRKSWGHPAARAPKPEDARLYHDLRSADDDTWTLGDRTWNDLFMPQVFAQICHTRSAPGGQILYRMLRCPSFSAEEISNRNSVIESLSVKSGQRENLQQLLDALNSEDAAQLPNLFLTEMPLRPAYWWACPVLTLLMIAAIAGAIFNHGLVIVTIPLMITNLAVAKVFRDSVDAWIHPLRVCNTLVRQSRKVAETVNSGDCAGLKRLVQPINDAGPALAELDRTTRWLLFERNSSGDPIMILVEYINMILLLDVNSFLFAMEAIRKHHVVLGKLFETIGMVDALIGVASYRHSIKQWCVPQFHANSRKMSLQGALHPILPDGVPNSLEIDGHGILITGSNMSGKTTFIRTVAINTLLAQSIATCTAESYCAEMMGVESSIGRSDSLSEGRSFYMDEVETIGDFLEEADGEAPCMFIIDEIFRGTNTTERVAASKAVLDCLNQPGRSHIVLISTHDVELPNLLETPFDRYHFRESVVEGELEFDYLLRPGLSSTRNALRLLESRGYPAEVVADAMATARKIEDGLEQRRSLLELERAGS